MKTAVVIPDAIARSDEYLALPDDQKKYFLQRLDGIQEIGYELANETKFKSSTDFCDFASELELDVLLRQELSLVDRGSLSRWLIHHSWTFNASPLQMVDHVSSELLALSDLVEPSLGAPIETQVAWLKNAGMVINRLVEEFSSAATFPRAIAIHILLDICMAKLLVACFKLRLNPNLSR